LGNTEFVGGAFTDVPFGVYKVAEAVITKLFEVMQVQQLDHTRVLANFIFKQGETLSFGHQFPSFWCENLNPSGRK
jgi:hypothetical protein